MGEVASKICGDGGPLDFLIKQYGDDVGRFIAVEKVKQFVDTKIVDAKNGVGQQSGSVLNQVQGTIDGKKVQLTNMFQGFKETINQKVPGGISSLEKLQNNSIENILGLPEFLKKFDDLKSTASTKFSEQQKNVYGVIDEAGKKQKQLLNSQRPQLPLYQKLPQSQQKLVFQEGQKIFAKQIDQQKSTIMKQIGDKLNPEQYLGNFKNLVPAGSLDGILGNAKSKFQTVQATLNGGASIGGLFGAFGF